MVNHTRCFTAWRKLAKTRDASWLTMPTSNEGGKFDEWYVDSGCSRHMTGNQDILAEIYHMKGGRVTFGDGKKGKIQGAGHCENSEQPRLINVYLVEGLKAKLISISQLCDEGLTVIFTKVYWKALDDKGNVRIQGIISDNNCYMWNATNQCMLTTKSQPDIWHRKLKHMSPHGLSRLVNSGVVWGVPKLEISTDLVCDACCKGKQVKVQHKQISDIWTTGLLELVHMDLMGPVQTASGWHLSVYIGNVLREKSDEIRSFNILEIIRSDHWGELYNDIFQKFCQEQGNWHRYSAPCTTQQNEVVERKNQTLK